MALRKRHLQDEAEEQLQTEESQSQLDFESQPASYESSNSISADSEDVSS